MKRYMNTLLVIITIFFCLPDNGFTQEDGTMVESISGILVKIDESRQFIFIESSQRITKFYTSAEICEEFKNSINARVTVTFTRKKEGGLQLITMQVDP